MTQKRYDAIILGAGAAGLMCAATAGQRGRKVLILDHAPEVGRKILISGGGRCNFTNIFCAPDRYISQNRHFARSALSRYTAQDFIDLVDRHGIAWHEKTLGQLFCDGSARQIVKMLLDECDAGGVDIACDSAIADIGHADGIFTVRAGGLSFEASSLVLATGGPSIPKMGATGFAYDVARQLGMKIVQPRPALVPLTLSQDEALFRNLSGVATPVVAQCNKTQFREAALFTHKGLSGPAILQISSYWQHGQEIGIDFLSDMAAGWLRDAKRQRPKASLRKILSDALPDRLADALTERFEIDRELGNVSDRVLEDAEKRLGNWPFLPTGTEGFAKAEVTSGGIDTAGLSSRTMEASAVPGLYAIGEAVDVTGWLGGYNFQWAWASGVAAGQSV